MGMTPVDYWQNNMALAHLTPPGDRFPEGNLAPVMASLVVGHVCDFGCGDGRLAPLFYEGGYFGCDINPAAIRQARLNHPAYSFGLTLYEADTVLAHTVLLHIPDDSIGTTLDAFTDYWRVVIGEIMGRQWRRPGNPPVFNRDESDYIAMMEQRDYRLVDKQTLPYWRYNNTDITFLAFDRNHY